MRRFSDLYLRLDTTTATNAKLAALVAYLQNTPPHDAAWAVYFLAGGKPRQSVPTRLMRAAVQRLVQIPDWLFEESYQAVGDLAETMALLLPPPRQTSNLGLASWIETRLLPLRGVSPEEAEAALTGWWDETTTAERFLLTKLIGGGFRVGVSRLLVTRALATVAGLEVKIIAQRMVGWTSSTSGTAGNVGTARVPSAQRYEALIASTSAGDADANDANDANDTNERQSQPYPFFLAHPLPDVASLGPIEDWLVEWKYDGIRAQLVKRAGQVWLWSRGEELLTERFPELAELAALLEDGTVIDGEILVWPEGVERPAAFAELQTRITRKSVSKKMQAEKPVCLVAYDLLERHGRDLRASSQEARGLGLAEVVERATHPRLRLSPQVVAASWDALATQRQQARARGVEGLMLKHRQARYGVGRTKSDGIWWKWKVDPLSVDAVLIYAQAGHGRRASLYTDFTFAVWDRPVDQPGRVLVPFAKAYSGLTDAEIKQVDAVIRKTTIEKFGPVRSVTPTLVFELGFEGIQRSSRHKSGIAVRFPRMLRWRTDKTIEAADTLQSLEALLELKPDLNVDVQPELPRSDDGKA